VALGGAKVHCGVCAACLLRRQSLFAARVDEREEYQWPNLKKASLADAAADGARETNTDDYRHVACGVLCMEYFARLLDSSSGDGIRQAVADMPRSLGTDLEIEHKLKRLIIAHKTEWHAFTLAQGKQSLINDLLGKII